MDGYKVKHKFLKIALAVFLCFLGAYLFHTWATFSKAAIDSDFFVESEYASLDASIYLHFEDESSGVLYSDLDETKTSYVNSAYFMWSFNEGLMQIKENESDVVLDLLYCTSDRFFAVERNVFLYRVAR